MEMKTAGEIMIPLDKYPHIPYWFTVRQAIAEIHHAELEINGRKSLARAVLVFDEEYKLLGMVRRRDILRGVEPENFLGKHAQYSRKLFDVHADPNLLEMSYDKLSNEFKKQAEQPVSSIMMPIKVTVEEKDHLVKIIFEMNEFKVSMLPVLKDNVIVGVVRTVEVLDEIGKLLGVVK